MNTPVYHFTTPYNALRILEAGELRCNRLLCESQAPFDDIGSVVLKRRRDEKLVPHVLGAQLAVGDFVPFYFAMHPPMYWVVRQTVRELAYIETTLDRLLEHGSHLVVSDGNASSPRSSFTSIRRPSQVKRLVDLRWLAEGNIEREDVGDSEKKRRFQAEVLALEAVRTTALERVVFMSDESLMAAVKWATWASVDSLPRLIADPDYFPSEAY